MSQIQPLDFLFFGIILMCLTYSSLQFYRNYVMINENTNDEELMLKYLKLVELQRNKNV